MLGLDGVRSYFLPKLSILLATQRARDTVNEFSQFVEGILYPIDRGLVRAILVTSLRRNSA